MKSFISRSKNAVVSVNIGKLVSANVVLKISPRHQLYELKVYLFVFMFFTFFCLIFILDFNGGLEDFTGGL